MKVVLFFGLLILSILTFVWLGDSININWSKYLILIQSMQKGLHLTLANTLRSIEVDGLGASASLIGFSFLYGIFHAAGPGHGKVVISTYLFSHESQLRRGILLSFASSSVQGLGAIMIVSVAVWLLDYSMRQTSAVVNDVEIASFALIALVGLFILLSRTVRLLNSFGFFSASGAAAWRNHNDGCEQRHGPDPKEISDELRLGTFLAIVLSIGIRPCSGAVIVLLLAYSLNLPAAGLFAVLAMSFGTALTVSLLAVLSVYFRKLANQLLMIMPDGNYRFARAADFLGAVAGAIICVFGLMLLNTALFGPSHPFRV